LEPEDCAVSENEDTETFQIWLAEFDRRCRAFGWLTVDTMVEILLEQYKQGSPGLDQPLSLIGFDELTPLQQGLMAALGSHCTVKWIRLSGLEACTVRFACEDTQDEIKTLVRWARRRLEANPLARIGIIVPRLTEQRTSLAVALDEVLVPEVICPGKAASQRPWNISLGTPLGEQPMIQSAFLLLDLMRGRLSLDQAGRLLRSPHVGEAQYEAGPRALLDVQLRQRGEPEVSLNNLIYFAGQQDRPEYSPLLLDRLHALQGAKEQGLGKASSVEWAGLFAFWLKAGGWAQGRTLSSVEFQLVEKWRELLSTFSALEMVTEPLSVAEALAILRRLAADRIFQPQAEESPIQVLGLYEAIGQHFDHLWVTGLHDEEWPPAPAPNPFLPLRLQRQQGMPRASQERELQVAHQVTKRLSESAPEVVMSYPKKLGAEPLRPSPLIMDLPEIGREELSCWQGMSWRELVRDASRLETVKQDKGPPLERKQARGGSSLFRLQSLCPFRAYAEIRLSARPLEQASLGLDARQRGTLLHKVMELFWREVGSHQSLLGMQESELRSLIDAKIKLALEEMARLKPQAMTRNFMAVEKDRLRLLVHKWLQSVEWPRADFEVIGHEQAVDATISGVEVHLLIDRIDRLADGRKMVIDYKTGTVKPGQWFGERPEEPQLPLYSTVIEEEVAGVLFGQMRAGDLRLNGVVAEEGLIEGLPGRHAEQKKATQNWSQLQIDWRNMLERLAHDFSQGVADVDPKQESTCKTSYCTLAPLCRIHEHRALNNQLLLEDDDD
jgi:probable DNA repair protein